MYEEHAQVMVAGSLPAYFHSELETAMERRAVESADATRWYLANLLTRFSRSDRLFDYDREQGISLRPLALMYADAAQASSESERRLGLQRMGDVALFIAGLFEGVLSRRGVRLEYFVTMGCGAYAYLAENPGRGNDETVFSELSSRFALFVDVLSMVGSNDRRFGVEEVLRLYQLWEQTGSPLAERQLRALGVALDERGRAH